MSARCRPSRVREMSEVEKAWLAGLLEGEGSFMRLDRASRPGERPRLSCIMSDLDIIQRLADVTGVGIVKLHPTRDDNRLGKKPLYSWITTRHAEVRDICHAIRPHMGERRRAQIDRILDLLADINIVPEGHCAKGHAVEGDNAMPAGSQGVRCRTCHGRNRVAA